MRIGVPDVNGFHSDTRPVFNPILVITAMCLGVFKSFTTIFISNKSYSKIIGDFTYNWKYRIQWKCFEVSMGLLIIFLILLSYLNYENDKIALILKRELNIKKLNPKSTKLFRILNYFVDSNSLQFAIIMNLIFIISLFEFSYYIIFIFFWGIAYYLTSKYTVNIELWHLFSFILYCLRSRILLSIENKSLTKMIVKQKPISNIIIWTSIETIGSNYIAISKIGT